MTRLTTHFRGVSSKQLSAVETQRHTSNQHEFNGTSAMKRYLGTERRCFDARFIYMGADEDDRLSLDDVVTWYDSRESHPSRSEHRLYFRSNEVMTKAAEGDILLAALGTDDTMLLLIISAECAVLGQVLWLFGVSDTPSQTFTTVDTETDSDKSTAIFTYIAEGAGLELEQPEGDGWLDILLERFGPRFPSTRELSELALETLTGDISPKEEPDNTLIALMDREEAMFRQLERLVVSNHLAEHASSWADDVDAFVKFSLSVQNRRKSRAGHALENHLEWTFSQCSLQFQRGVRTENHSKPDFLFPGQAQYLDDSYPADQLIMLGVKTSCKDRWRQVLNEAMRIPDKHLLTLQPAISEHQTDEMRTANLSLVLPASLHSSYNEKQKPQLLSLADFIGLVEARQ